MRFVIAANLLGLPAISVPVSDAFLFLKNLSEVFCGLYVLGTLLLFFVNAINRNRLPPSQQIMKFPFVLQPMSQQLPPVLIIFNTIYKL